MLVIIYCAICCEYAENELQMAPNVVHNRSNQSAYDAAETLACLRRRNDVTRCRGVYMLPYGPLYANMSSIIKPEVHNVKTYRYVTIG